MTHSHLAHDLHFLFDCVTYCVLSKNKNFQCCFLCCEPSTHASGLTTVAVYSLSASSYNSDLFIKYELCIVMLLRETDFPVLVEESEHSRLVYKETFKCFRLIILNFVTFICCQKLPSSSNLIFFSIY